MVKLRVATVLALLTLVFSCGKQVTKQTVVIEKGHEIVSTEKKDTLGYVISFYDTTERGKFVRSFEHLVKTYPFRRDTLVNDRFFSLTLPPPPPVEAPKPRPVVSETLATLPQPVSPAAAEVQPRVGGAVTLYSQREFLDPSLSGFVSSYPFSQNACGGESMPKDNPGLLDMKVVSDRQIDITLRNNVATATGQTLSAFDLVNAWTAYIKKNPAEGCALFRYVKGLDGFIAGREAIISGFVVVDERTVSLRLEKPDPLATTRLCTRRLLPTSLKTGLYYSKGENQGSVRLFPNPRPGSSKAYLNSCTIRLGKDPNPFLSFSLNRFDAITLFSVKDLDYARQKNADKSSLTVLSDDRYFLSLAMPAKDMRLFSRKLLDARDILVNFVKADGAVISLVESENGPTSPPDQAGQPLLQTAPPLQGPLSVLFRSDDPVSVIVANKVLADFSRAGLQCVLKGTGCEGYEASLVRRDYGIAVGWVPKAVLTDQSERVRLATQWFSDVADERSRVDDSKEIPLFSIKQYLLCKKRIGFDGDVLEGMFVQD